MHGFVHSDICHHLTNVNSLYFIKNFHFLH